MFLKMFKPVNVNAYNRCVKTHCASTKFLAKVQQYVVQRNSLYEQRQTSSNSSNNLNNSKNQFNSDYQRLLDFYGNIYQTDLSKKSSNYIDPIFQFSLIQKQFVERFGTFQNYRTKQLKLKTQQNYKDMIQMVQQCDNFEECEEWFKKKIQNTFDKYYNNYLDCGIENPSQLFQTIKENPIILIGFEKNPLKQSFDEQLQIEFINRKIEYINRVAGRNMGDFDVISSNNTFRLNSVVKHTKGLCLDHTHEGLKIIKYNESYNGNRTKTFDAEYKSVLTGTHFYLYFKHIDGKGGSQDNQYMDLVYFIQTCLQYYDNLNVSSENSEKTAFVIVCDGTYFTEDKMNTLKQQCDNTFITIQNSDQIFTF